MNTAIPYFKNLEKISNAIIVMGILLGTLGIIAIGYPEIAGKTTVAVLGIFLVFGAILRGTFAIFSFSMGRMILQYILAILMMITGLWLLTNQAAGLQTVTIVLGVFFIVDGGTFIVYSFSLKPIGVGGWLLFNGIIGILVGILIWIHWLESGSYFLGLYVGVKLFLDGVVYILTGYTARKNSPLN
jgi:uncharacterized membrane protein HdeD (DUF308 family)